MTGPPFRGVNLLCGAGPEWPPNRVTEVAILCLALSINLEAEALELAEDVVNKACQGILGHLELDMWRSLLKIEVLVEELSNLQRQDCTTKSIVFSQLCMNVLSQHQVIYS